MCDRDTPLHLGINRIRLEFKVLLIVTYLPIGMRINRIRLEFKAFLLPI